MTKPVYDIDGREFSTLEEFYDVVSSVLIPGADWGHNLRDMVLAVRNKKTEWS